MAKDPVCGMQVDEEGPIRVQHKDKTYSFCSEGCKARFQEDPDRFITRKQEERDKR